MESLHNAETETCRANIWIKLKSPFYATKQLKLINTSSFIRAKKNHRNDFRFPMSYLSLSFSSNKAGEDTSLIFHNSPAHPFMSFRRSKKCAKKRGNDVVNEARVKNDNSQCAAADDYD